MSIPEPATIPPSEPAGPAPSPAGTVALARVAIVLGVVSLPGLLVFVPAVRDSPVFVLVLLASYVAPFTATVSWLLAVVAAVLSGARLIRRRRVRESKRALALAAPGAVLGTAALVFVVVYIGNMLGAFDPNEAARSGELAVDHYLDQGSSLICDHGNNGHGVNSTPWYVAYIDAPSDLQSAEQAQEALALAGFPDTRRAEIPEEYGQPVLTEAFRVESPEYDVSRDEALESPRAYVEVYPVERVSVSCSPPGGDYGDDLTADEGRAIVVVHVTLEPTR